MSTQKLDSLKLKFVKDFLEEEDEDVVMKAIDSFRRAIRNRDKSERIPGLSYTHEDRVSEINEAEEDIREGRVYTAEEVRKRYPRL